MRRLDAAAIALFALCAASLLTGLARFPALTSDEAWMGLYAMRLAAHGLFTPHEMNTYTGPLFGLALARTSEWFGVGVGSLRLFGAAANVLAFALVGVQLRRRAADSAAAWWMLLLAGSAYLLLKSRLAWDVYALQPLLLASTVLVLDGPASPARVFALAALTVLGAQNHFIYLSVPASLVVLFGALALRGDADARPRLRAALSALAAGAVVFLVKPRLTEAAWPVSRAWALPLFFALPAASAAAFAAGSWEKPLLRLVPRRAAAAVLALGLAAFAIWHGAPLWQALAGPTVWKRVLSWAAPWELDAVTGTWAAVLIAVAAWRAVRAWHGREALSELERTIALWPAAYASIFILFRNTSSLRYYSIAQFLTLVSAAAGLARLPRPDRRWALGLGALAAAAAQGVLWREIRAPAERPPLYFHIGWHAENSEDFTRKDALFAAYDASGACSVAHPENSFTAVPLIYYRDAAGPVACDPSLLFDASICRDCAAPPYYRWRAVPR
jgi:hypothetical protein